MNQLRSLLMIFLITFLSPSLSVAAGSVAADSCECPALECDSCASQQGLTFFSEKCDGGKKVKSCARPTCVALDPLPSQCKSNANYSEPRRSIASPHAPKVEVKTNARDMVKRGPEVGSVEAVKGRVWLKHVKGAKQPVVQGMKVHQLDILETSKTGRLKMKFHDGNEINLTPNSKIKLTEVSQAKKRTVIDLIKGRVRNKVKNKYKGANHFYRIRTKAAVAGVRGTDFVVTYEQDARAITKIETLEGSVKLMSHDREDTQVVKAGEYGSYVVAVNDDSVFNDDEISEFVARGYMTPVYQMTSKEVKNLRFQTEVVNGRKVRNIASTKKSSAICSAPKASLNQCAWTCQNNPKGETRCRADLPQVNCLRRRCNANGKWSEDTRLPASFYDACQARGTKVAPCDY